jgi:ABC-type transport system substrate-binding protein
MIRFCRKRFWSIFTVPFITTLVAAVVAAILSGCTPGDRPASGTAEPSTITLHYPDNERVFSPAHWVSYRNLVFAHLMRWDENGEMQGWLADRWEHSEDFRTWTYHLRENARWHDGVPITTADVEFTLNLLTHPELVVLDPADFELTVVDDHTFTVTAETPDAMGWMQWEVICYPKHLLKDLDPAGFYDWDWWITPIGNGPFRYVTHSPETYTELEANPDYFLDGPGVDRIRIRYGGSGLVELLAGNVNVYSGASLTEAHSLEEDSRFEVYFENPGGSYWAIVWNHNRPQFQDAATRKALTLALDRASLFSALDIPDGIPILDGPNPARIGEPPPPPLPFDPESARDLLSNAGWTDEDDDGVLERDGVELSFELLAFAGGNDATVLIQNDLAQTGARVSITTLTMDAVRGRMRGSEFDAGIFRTSRGYLENYLFGSRDILEVRANHLTILNPRPGIPTPPWSWPWRRRPGPSIRERVAGPGRFYGRSSRGTSPSRTSTRRWALL